jgi:hypothetical protein
MVFRGLKRSKIIMSGYYLQPSIDGEYVQNIPCQECHIDPIALALLKGVAVCLRTMSSIDKKCLRYTNAEAFDGRQGEENWDDWLTVSNSLARVDFVQDWGRLVGLNRDLDE